MEHNLYLQIDSCGIVVIDTEQHIEHVLESSSALEDIIESYIKHDDLPLPINVAHYMYRNRQTE